MILIILRGPAGSGKSEVCCELRKKIEREKSIKSYFFNLDEICHEKFENYVKEALKSKYVIGEMFSGNGHTSNPKPWINKFTDKDYKIFSFILKVSLDTCLQRCRSDKKNKRDSVYQNGDQLNKDYYKFYNYPEFGNFANNAIIIEETIDSETKSIQEVVSIISSK